MRYTIIYTYGRHRYTMDADSLEDVAAKVIRILARGDSIISIAEKGKMINEHFR